MPIIRLAAAVSAVALAAGCTTIPLPRMKDGPEHKLERKPVIGTREPGPAAAGLGNPALVRSLTRRASRRRSKGMG